jgi:thiol-disulfide isomerase/thioredoxin
MRDKIVKYIKELAIFFIIMILLANILSLYRSGDLNKERLDLSFITSIQNSQTVKNTKPTLIYFWGSWCPICKAQSPNIERVSKEFNVLSVAVKSGNDLEVENYLKERDLHFKFIADPDGSLAKKFNVSIFPTTIIFDKDGYEVFSDVGYTTTIGLWFKMCWVSL